MPQLLEDFGESQDNAFRQLHNIGREHQRAEEVRKSKAIILPDSDSMQQHGSPHEQDVALEVTTAAAPNDISLAPVVTADKTVQRDPYHTPIGTKEEIRAEPPVESLQEDAMPDHQEGDAASVETTVRGPPAKLENGELIHVTTLPVTIKNEKRPELNILDIFDE